MRGGGSLLLKGQKTAPPTASNGACALLGLIVDPGWLGSDAHLQPRRVKPGMPRTRYRGRSQLGVRVHGEGDELLAER